MSNFFQTLGTGYKRMWGETSFWVKNNSHKIFGATSGGLSTLACIFFARDAAKKELREALEECNKEIDLLRDDMMYAKENNDKEFEKKAKKSYYKKKLKKVGTFVKHNWKGIAAQTGSLVTGGLCVASADDKITTAVGATAALGAEFLAYRSNVIADQGEEKDREYLTTKNVPRKTDIRKEVDPDTGEVKTEAFEDGGRITVDADPSALKFLYSRENCPIWEANYDLRLMQLDNICSELTYMGRGTGHLSLNDQRRKFGGVQPRKMDVPIGGIMGRIFDPDKPETMRVVNLHYQEDEDFMSGKKDWVWIIFDLDKEPMINRMKKEFTQVED